MDYKTFTEDQATTWGNQLYSQSGATYREQNSNGESGVVAYYCGNCHIYYNSILRGMPNITEDERLNKEIKALKKIIEEAPRTDQDLIAWRIVPDDIAKQIMTSSQKPNFFLEKGFLSTSLTQESCWINFHEVSKLNYMLRIKIPRGSAGIYTPAYVTDRREQELLLMPNTKLQYEDHFHTKYFIPNCFLPKYLHEKYLQNKIRIIPLQAQQ